MQFEKKNTRKKQMGTVVCQKCSVPREYYGAKVTTSCVYHGARFKDPFEKSLFFGRCQDCMSFHTGDGCSHRFKTKYCVF
jgi:hypothetical protein